MNCQDEYRGEDGYIYKIIEFINEPSVVMQCVVTGERTVRMGVRSPMFEKFKKIKIDVY